MLYKLFFVLLVFCQSLSSQVIFTPHDISNNQDFPVVVLAEDIDGDGDIDIICGAQGTESIIWYENVDGEENFEIAHFVAGSFDHLYDIHLADLDGDNDLDLISSATSSDEVAWYENVDGLGNFSTRKIISDIEWGPYGIDAADLDGDNDLDILTNSDYGTSSYYWHENIDGMGNFGPGNFYMTAGWPKRNKGVDIDNDGDLDIVTCDAGGLGLIRWIENIDGLGNFENVRIVDNQSYYVEYIRVIDFDHDNDLDIIANNNAIQESEIIWYENVDGLGNFGPTQVIAETGYRPWTIEPADFDGDGDYDLVYSTLRHSSTWGALYWIENLGDQTFGPSQIIIENNFQDVRAIVPIDIDEDGDIDFVSISAEDNRITWFENEVTLGAIKNNILRFSISPNPSSKIINIKSEQVVKSVIIYDTTGKLVLTAQNQLNIQIDSLTSGVYFIIITDIDGYDETQKLIIN